MIDKYQVYMLYKKVKQMWKAKRFDTIVFNDFFDDTLDNYIINQFINDGPGVEYMSNWFINLVNEMNCGIVNLAEWLMYVMTFILVNKRMPEAKEINSMNKLRQYTVFMGRDIVKSQIKYIRALTEERNSGIGYFTDNRFSLYELDDKQENEAYRMYRDGKLDPEFYIRGIYNNVFSVDKSTIKDIDYKRFITFCEMIVKLKKENSTNSATKNIP